jgi:hypothetical protein
MHHLKSMFIKVPNMQQQGSKFVARNALQSLPIFGKRDFFKNGIYGVGEYEISRAPSPKQAKRGLLS